MNIIFPSSPLSNKVDLFWEEESLAAKEAGFDISIVTDHNDLGPIKLFNKSDFYLYRGWIAKVQRYKELCDIADNHLLNSYNDYLWSFDFPRWYTALNNEDTPKSFYFSADEIQNLGLEKMAEQVFYIFGNQSLMIKDWLKSRKHEWFDACFIKDASDTKDVVRVMTNFFNLQGRDFYGGLVFRKFIELNKLGTHPKSVMPLPLEFRTFFLNKKPMVTSLYWNDDAEYPKDIKYPPQEWLEYIGNKMKSPFVALDIAQDELGKWWVIEVNDGGIAGYPKSLGSKLFYKLLYDGLK